MSHGHPGGWRVDVLAYPGCLGAVLFGLVDVLAVANTLSGVLLPGTGALPAPAAASADLLVRRLGSAHERDG